MIMTVNWIMATKSLNVRALAVWAVAPLAVAGAVWLIDRAWLWGLGLLAIWVGLGVVAPLPLLRHRYIAQPTGSTSTSSEAGDCEARRAADWLRA